MPTIDATVKGAAANSYVTEAEALDYFANKRPNGAAWAASTDAIRQVALIAATRQLDSRVMWIGSKTTNEQALMWPRSGVPDKYGFGTFWNLLNPDTTPTFVKEGQMEQAFYLLANNPYVESDKRGINSVKVDVIEVEFDKSARGQDVTLCRATRELISEFGTFEGNRPMQVNVARV